MGVFVACIYPFWRRRGVEKSTYNNHRCNQFEKIEKRRLCGVKVTADTGRYFVENCFTIWGGRAKCIE